MRVVRGPARDLGIALDGAQVEIRGEPYDRTGTAPRSPTTGLRAAGRPDGTRGLRYSGHDRDLWVHKLTIVVGASRAVWTWHPSAPTLGAGGDDWTTPFAMLVRLTRHGGPPAAPGGAGFPARYRAAMAAYRRRHPHAWPSQTQLVRQLAIAPETLRRALRFWGFGWPPNPDEDAWKNSSV